MKIKAIVFALLLVLVVLGFVFGTNKNIRDQLTELSIQSDIEDLKIGYLFPKNNRYEIVQYECGTDKLQGVPNTSDFPVRTAISVLEEYAQDTVSEGYVLYFNINIFDPIPSENTILDVSLYEFDGERPVGLRTLNPQIITGLPIGFCGEIHASMLVPDMNVEWGQINTVDNFILSLDVYLSNYISDNNRISKSWGVNSLLTVEKRDLKKEEKHTLEVLVNEQPLWSYDTGNELFVDGYQYEIENFKLLGEMLQQKFRFPLDQAVGICGGINENISSEAVFSCVWNDIDIVRQIIPYWPERKTEIDVKEIEFIVL